jgi:hypothetical protein
MCDILQIEELEKTMDRVFKLECFIIDFSLWDDTVHEAIITFYQKFYFFPNILLAGNLIYRKIDLYGQKYPERLIDPDGEKTIEISQLPYAGISYFTGQTYSLEFCLNEELAVGNFTLIYDEMLEFDREPIGEKEKTSERQYFYRESA